MLNDILSDGITRLRNAGMRGINKVSLLNSKVMREILRVLNEEGYINEFQETADKREVVVNLRYYKGKHVIREIRRISVCSRRVYTGAHMPKLKNDFGMFIVSTSQGIMPSYKAKNLGIGGEIFVEIM
jgi:small subunit ribosomal protein S8